MRFRTPANVLLRRAQLILMLAALVPTVLITALGIVLLIVGSESISLVIIGVLVLTFCTTSVTGYILGSIFVSRGASVSRLQNDFLSSVSHELRTPLTSIRLFIETLRDGRVTDPEEQRKCLDLLYGEVERLDELVSRLLELSRIETGRQLLAREPIDMADVVGDALAAFDAATLSDPVRIKVDLHEGLLVNGDRPMLARAFTNLLVNAWKYGGEERDIRLQVRPEGEKRVEVIVSDTGPGIPRSEQRAIFEKFERGRMAIDAHSGGVGLGLSIVRAIVRAHKGQVEVRSKTGRGSEFRIVLPRRRT